MEQTTVCLECNTDLPEDQQEIGYCPQCIEQRKKDHYGVGCGTPIIVYVPTKYSTKPIRTSCGSTGIYGSPEFCAECEPKYAGRDWRREAIEAGERWDDDDPAW